MSCHGPSAADFDEEAEALPLTWKKLKVADLTAHRAAKSMFKQRQVTENSVDPSQQDMPQPAGFSDRSCHLLPAARWHDGGSWRSVKSPHA